jgi:pyrroloquinoline quinone biosynthesis protein B
VLINASPDLLAQIKAFPALQPNRAIRDTGIRAIILCDGQIDHTTGLLMLREGKRLEIWCTEMVHEDLTTGNPLFDILGHYCGVDWRRLPLEQDATFSVDGIADVRFAAVPLASKAPPYSPHRNDPHEGDNVGLRITDTRSGRSLFYAPGLGEIEPRVATHLRDADALMVDGTFWTDDEMIRLGVSKKRARDIGHLPQSGAGGMIRGARPLARVAQSPHTHQQHEPHPDRGLAGARRIAARGHRWSHTTGWRSRSEGAAVSASAKRPWRARSSRRSCARRGSAITSIIPTTSR